MSGFTDPIVGGSGNLIRQSIQSPNFNITNGTGWSIDKNGNAYFFNVTASGTITATTVVVEGSNGAILIYSGIPAAGNLINSIAGAPGVDIYGNSYPNGFATFNGTEIVIGNWSTNGLVLNGANAIGQVHFDSSAGGVSPNMKMQSGLAPSGTFPAQMQVQNSLLVNTLDTLLLLGPQSPSTTDTGETYAYITLTQGTTASEAFGQLVLWHVSSGAKIMLEWNSNGIYVPTLSAFSPGTTTPETWNTPSLSVDWANVTGQQVARYQYEPINGGRVRLDGSVQSTGILGANSPYFTAPLPVAYRPTTQKRFSGVVTNISGGGFGKTIVMIDTAGNVTCPDTTNAANQQVCFDGITYPLD